MAAQISVTLGSGQGLKKPWNSLASQCRQIRTVEFSERPKYKMERDQ